MSGIGKVIDFATASGRVLEDYAAQHLPPPSLWRGKRMVVLPGGDLGSLLSEAEAAVGVRAFRAGAAAGTNQALGGSDGCAAPIRLRLPHGDWRATLAEALEFATLLGPLSVCASAIYSGEDSPVASELFLSPDDTAFGYAARGIVGTPKSIHRIAYRFFAGLAVTTRGDLALDGVDDLFRQVLTATGTGLPVFDDLFLESGLMEIRPLVAKAD